MDVLFSPLFVPVTPLKCPYLLGLVGGRVTHCSNGNKLNCPRLTPKVLGRCHRVPTAQYTPVPTPPPYSLVVLKNRGTRKDSTKNPMYSTPWAVPLGRDISGGQAGDTVARRHPRIGRESPASIPCAFFKKTVFIKTIGGSFPGSRHTNPAWGVVSPARQVQQRRAGRHPPALPGASHTLHMLHDQLMSDQSLYRTKSMKTGHFLGCKAAREPCCEPYRPLKPTRKKD